MNETNLMSKMKISKAVATMAIPSVISSLVTVVYNMADTFFVGQTGDPLQVAAVSLTNPIFILFMAFANMFGMGGSATASIAMGEKNEKRMKNVSAFITYASLITGIFFAVILLLGAKPILQIFGADKQTYDLAYGYLFHISYGAPFVIWSAAASFDRKYDRNDRKYHFRSDHDQRTSYGSSRSCDRNNDRKYSGKFILCLVFYKEKQVLFHPSRIFQIQRQNPYNCL